MKRFAAAIGLAAMSVMGVAVAATPAAASPADCRNYLRSEGYVVGTKVTRACKSFAHGNSIEYNAAFLTLLELGVTKPDATHAARLARL
ncbi:hypothetical protein ACIBG7_15775 [Nonomuraea sp. NPDC050328]|uniref:hypothetical protein n=1 Tax=Nonomuraea sp. NPDC050328 TaxID=3364361 RepID=UPI0037B84BD1